MAKATKKAVTKKAASKKTTSKIQAASKKTNTTPLKATTARKATKKARVPVSTAGNRATSVLGRLPITMTLAQAKKIKAKLDKIDFNFDFLDKKINTALNA